MRRCIYQTVRFNDPYCYGREVTMDINIYANMRKFDFYCSEYVSPLTLYEIMVANKHIRKMTDWLDDRDVRIIRERDKEDYIVYDKNDTVELISCPYEEGYKIRKGFMLYPAEFFGIIFHILRNKFHTEPKIQHYKLHRKFLRKNADFRYCQTDYVEPIWNELDEIKGVDIFEEEFSSYDMFDRMGVYDDLNEEEKIIAKEMLDEAHQELLDAAREE